MNNIRHIPLGGKKANGRTAIIDEGDYNLVSRYSWCLKDKDYVVGWANGRVTRLHRFLLDAPDDMCVDHINGNTLDNRRANLRLATNSENLRNRGAQRNGSSGYKGVTYYKARGNWAACINVDRKSIFLGYHKTAIDAARAYNIAALTYHGEFAKLNDV